MAYALACDKVVEAPPLVLLTSPTPQVPVAVLHLLAMTETEGVHESLPSKEIPERISFLLCETGPFLLAFGPKDVYFLICDIQVPAYDHRLPLSYLKILQVSLEVAVPLLHAVVKSVQAVNAGIRHIGSD